MSEVKFREDEVVRIRGKNYPLLAGRLRLALESTQMIVVRSELLRFEPGELAVTKVTVETAGGTVSAHGTAVASRDPEFVGALVELSESRGLARCCRWLGHGHSVGFEEIGDGPVFDGTQRGSARHPAVASIEQGNRRDPRSHRGTPATSAQRRALAALSQRLGKDLDAVIASAFPDTDPHTITLPQASALIDRLKAAAGNGSNHAGGR